MKRLFALSWLCLLAACQTKQANQSATTIIRGNGNKVKTKQVAFDSVTITGKSSFQAIDGDGNEVFVDQK